MAVPLPVLAAILEQNHRKRERVHRPLRGDAFSLPDAEFRCLFRLSKELVRELCACLAQELKPKTRRRDAFSVETKVLCALRFFATGSYQKCISNDYLMSMSQKSASNNISAVCNAVIKCLLDKWVYFPTDADRQNQIKQQFYAAYGFPGIVGVIDCTHVNIVAPPTDIEHQYVNRKGAHSVNVQLVCDYNLEVLNVNASFPGSAHDAHIWRTSGLRAAFCKGQFGEPGSCWLLGDAGYPLEPWLLTPCNRPSPGSAFARYNRVHASARSHIERCNGVLKTRFRCLLHHRVLHYSPETAAKIVLTCAVLHNMCIRHSIHLEVIIQEQMFDTADSSADILPIASADSIRRNLITTRFST